MEPMSLLAWVFVGAVAGSLASKVFHSDYWLIFDTLIGMAGALIGGFLYNEFGRSGGTDFNLWSVVVAFVGAVILLLLIRVVKPKRQAVAPINSDSE